MKSKITYVVVVGMCVLLMALAAGCGGQEQPAASDGAESAASGTEPGSEIQEEEEPVAETQEEREGETQAGGDSEGLAEPESAAPTEADKQEGKGSEKKLDGDELDGIVITVDKSNKTVVIDKFYIEADQESGLEKVHNQEGLLVNVYFLDDTSYILEEITDVGGNVTKKEAGFSDIQEGDMLHLKGKEAISDISGDEFLSSEVTITRVM